MPLPSSIVGRFGEPLAQPVDARWTMAYAAALGHDEPAYFDTAAGEVACHPLFPVCFEWPLFLDPRHLPSQDALTREERLRGVHATHDLVLHRPIRPGELVTRARAVRVEARRPGAYLLTRLDTTDGDGAPLCTTWYGSLFRGVAVDGPDRALEDEEPPSAPAVGEPAAAELPLPISAQQAHVYTECARIWNPIHTDRAVALAAGLPDLILHGTATLALAVSCVVRERLSGDPARVARVAGRFAAMVRMPSRCSVRVGAETDGVVPFEVRNAEGERAIRSGLLYVRS